MLPLVSQLLQCEGVTDAWENDGCSAYQQPLRLSLPWLGMEPGPWSSKNSDSYMAMYSCSKQAGFLVLLLFLSIVLDQIFVFSWNLLLHFLLCSFFFSLCRERAASSLSTKASMGLSHPFIGLANFRDLHCVTWVPPFTELLGFRMAT